MRNLNYCVLRPILVSKEEVSNRGCPPSSFARVSTPPEVCAIPHPPALNLTEEVQPPSNSGAVEEKRNESKIDRFQQNRFDPSQRVESEKHQVANFQYEGKIQLSCLHSRPAPSLPSSFHLPSLRNRSMPVSGHWSDPLRLSLLNVFRGPIVRFLKVTYVADCLH